MASAPAYLDTSCQSGSLCRSYVASGEQMQMKCGFFAPPSVRLNVRALAFFSVRTALRTSATVSVSVPVSASRRGLAAGVLHVRAGAHGVARDPLDHGAQLLAEQLRAVVDHGVKAVMSSRSDTSMYAPYCLTSASTRDCSRLCPSGVTPSVSVRRSASGVNSS